MKSRRYRTGRALNPGTRQCPDHPAALIFFVSAAGYAAVYRYRAAEASYFGLPTELLSLDLKDVVAGGLGLTLAVLVLILLGNSLLKLVEIELPPPVEFRLKALVLMTLVYTAVLYMIGAPSSWYPSVFVAAVTFAFIQFVIPALRHSGESGYVEKLKADDEQKPGAFSPLLRFIRSRKQYFLPLLAVASVLLLAEPAGIHSARTRSSFAVIPGMPERVVVAEYRGSLVTMELDRESSTALPPFVVIRPEDVAAGMIVERLGRLDVSAREDN